MHRGINDCKKGYQPRTNIVKDEKGDLVADCNSILGRWRNQFSQLLINDDNKTEIHTAQPLVPEPSILEFELAIDELCQKSGIDQIPSELIKTGGRTIYYQIYKLISIWNKDELSEEWKQLFIVSIGRAIKQTAVIIQPYHFNCYIYNFIQHPAVKVNCICRGNYWGSSVWISMQQDNC